MQHDDEALAKMSLPMFHVMVALASEDLHGYAIMKDVAARTGGEVQLTAGTLYGIIKRLLADGFIAETTARVATPGDDARRRYYRLTPAGRKAALAEARRMEQTVAIARTALARR